MEHAIHKVTAFEIIGPYRLRFEFADGLVRTIDFSRSSRETSTGRYVIGVRSTQ